MKQRRRVWKRLLYAVLVVLALVLVPYGVSRLLSPWRMVAVHSTGQPMTAGTNSGGSLRLVAYNIAHGRGDGPASRNWTGESREDRLRRLDEIASLLRATEADIVVLNEVDFDASWSRGINQARVLAERAGYPYWVEQRNLDFRVLFWKWRFGNAVLSRHPITSASVIDLPGFSRTETLLAGSKRGVLCEIEVNGKPVQIAGVHLCHRSEEIRTQSAERLVALAAKSAIPFFVVGDLNSTPPEFREGQVDPPVRNAIQMLDRSARFNRMPTNRPTTAEMTFHSRSPGSVIDWIMIPRGWEFHEYRAVPSSLSDHRLVQAKATPAARALNSDLR